MKNTKDKAAGEGNLPIERVERIREYFKSLFDRSLKLGLDDGMHERPWEELSAPEERSQTRASIETDSRLAAAGTASDQGAGESEGEKAV